MEAFNSIHSIDALIGIVEYIKNHFMKSAYVRVAASDGVCTEKHDLYGQLERPNIFVKHLIPEL